MRGHAVHTAGRPCISIRVSARVEHPPHARPPREQALALRARQAQRGAPVDHARDIQLELSGTRPAAAQLPERGGLGVHRAASVQPAHVLIVPARDDAAVAHEHRAVLVAAARAPRLRGGGGHVLGARAAHARHCSIAASLKPAPPWLWYSGMLASAQAACFKLATTALTDRGAPEAGTTTGRRTLGTSPTALDSSSCSGRTACQFCARCTSA